MADGDAAEYIRQVRDEQAVKARVLLGEIESLESANARKRSRFST